MNYRRAFRIAVSVGTAVGILVSAARAQLRIGLSVDVARRDDGVFQYDYLLENTTQSSQSINSILLTTGANAPILSLSGPSDAWVAAYAVQDEVFQAGFATGLSADGDECGATSQFDVRPGQEARFTMTSLWGPSLQSFAVGRTVGIGPACDFLGDVATGLIAAPSDPIRICDVDGDGDCDTVDIDALATAIAIRWDGLVFDLNRDAAVDQRDLVRFLEVVSRPNGDADLNGAVDFADFLALSGNFSQNATWSQGDFDADGKVAFSDFLILSGSFGARTPTATVPEPKLPNMLLAVLLTYQFRRMRHRNGEARSPAPRNNFTHERTS